MNVESLKHELIDYMRGLATIDCHEHLRPENDRLEREVDVLTLLSTYAFADMSSAGRPLREGESLWTNNLLLDTSIPLDERWRQVEPYLQAIRYGSYYRATDVALRDIYGIDDLSSSTYHEASKRIAAANRKGIYTDILRDRCGIETCLVQNGLIDGQDPPELFTPVMIGVSTYQFSYPEQIEIIHKEAGVEVSDLDTYLMALEQHLVELRRQGAVEFKMSSERQVSPDLSAAREAYPETIKGAPAPDVLKSTVLDFILRRAAEWDWPVAAHCGVWNDFRTVDPKNMIDVVMRYPDVRFELYHLGMPFVRDCIFVAKSFANVYLNLCWCYVISEEITRASINEILDTVPVNKVFGFGGDYIWEVENVYGHLEMAREAIAEALSDRISRGRLDIEAAKRICRLWLHDNPAGFYGLGQSSVTEGDTR